MGVYLPNVDMPKGDKVLTVQICPDGSIWQLYRGTVPNAKATPVSPHGRLIDADALVNDMANMIPWAIDSPEEIAMMDGLSAGYEAVKAAPTIIPAEEGEDETD